jgi:hypothetical protein
MQHRIFQNSNQLQYNTHSMMYADTMIDTMSNDSIKSHTKQMRNMGAASWVVLATAVLGAYHLFSDGDFSVLMTLSSMAQAFGMVMLCIQLASTQSAKGISMKSMQLHAATFFFRFIATFFHEGYLPLDSSGDFIYRLAEFIGLGASGAAIFLAYRHFGHTIECEIDTFGEVGPLVGENGKFGAAWIASPALILAMMVHPSLNNSWWSDVAWTFALYMDVLAVAPQLYTFHKAGGAVASNTAHYVFSLGFGRVLQLLFWAYSFHELSEDSYGGFVGVFVILAQLIGAVLMADFFYYYAKSQQKGGPMILPSAVNMV